MIFAYRINQQDVLGLPALPTHSYPLTSALFTIYRTVIFPLNDRFFGLLNTVKVEIAQLSASN
jgi:hypothetical protein